MTRSFLAGLTILSLSTSVSLAGDLTSGNYYYAPPASSSAGGASTFFGDVNLSGTYTGGDGPDEFSLDLGGSFVVPFGNGWNVALDHELGYRFEAEDWLFGGTGHVFYANQAGAVGIFGYADSDETYGGGAEAAAFVGNLDLVGEVGYFSASPDYWAGEVSTNVYFDSNTALSGSVGAAWGDAEGWEADVGLEHRVMNSPISGFAEIGYTDVESDDAYHVTGGIRFVFGDSGTTLKEFNRRNPF